MSDTAVAEAVPAGVPAGDLVTEGATGDLEANVAQASQVEVQEARPVMKRMSSLMSGDMLGAENGQPAVLPPGLVHSPETGEVKHNPTTVAATFIISLIVPVTMLVYWSKYEDSWDDHKDGITCKKAYPTWFLATACIAMVMPFVNHFTSRMIVKHAIRMQAAKERGDLVAAMKESKESRRWVQMTLFLMMVMVCYNIYGLTLLFGSDEDCGPLWEFYYVLFFIGVAGGGCVCCGMCCLVGLFASNSGERI